MKKVVVLMFFVGLLAAIALRTEHANAATNQTCSAFDYGSILDLSSLGVQFECDTEQVVYFGVCDSGDVPNDDLFNIVFNNSVATFNTFTGGLETATIGSGVASAGLNTATLNSLTTTQYPPATYSYAIAPTQGAVAAYLSGACGVDYGGTTPLGICDRSVPLFTVDVAPSAGKLVMNVQFGQFSRQEGITVRAWNVVKGQRINNDIGIVPAPQYVRVWWQPTGSTEWYLLPSQYWQGDGTTKSEYGIDCKSSVVPSYHTSFELAIPESDVPLFKN